MNELTLHPVQFAETSLIVWTSFILSLNTSITDSTDSEPAKSTRSPNMCESALVSLVAGAIFLEKATRRDLVFVIDVQEFTVVSLLALVLEPVYAYRAFALAFIDSLLLRLQNRVDLVPALDLNGHSTFPISHGGSAIPELSRPGHL